MAKVGSLLCAFALCVGLTDASASGGLMTTLELNEKKCFYEKIQSAGGKLYVSVGVVDGGHDLTVNVAGPWTVADDQEPNILDKGNVIFDADMRTEFKNDMKLLYIGRQHEIFRVCLTNGGMAMKALSLQIKSNDMTDQGVGPLKPLEPIRRTIIRLSEALQQIEVEQTTLQATERINRELYQSTNFRIQFWSFMACVMLLAGAGWQLWYYNKLLGSQGIRRGV
eukprot:TRINITY_DN24934_c0_g1_i1.p1 TRINITY_DN24934_c0_g1~~TRINITY_DN24934_c0_g1_i1.p1  ORF type:complete len:241 (+),score=98.58 TRINITY_DN24934_c0_g1_i1:54-725(+)